VARLVVSEDLAGAAVEEFVRADPRVVALSGGTTPEPFYERLTELRYPWPSVAVLTADERCVPADHRDSNRALIERTLIRHLDPAPRAVWLPGNACDEVLAEEELREAFKPDLRLDLAVLGLGSDGHTASLFLGDPALDESERWVVRVERPDHPRLSLTLPVLSSASTALFLVSGRKKRYILWRFLDGEDLPANRVRSPNVVVVADPDAAG
jgi:6-phosphogluconolactonase